MRGIGIQIVLGLVGFSVALSSETTNGQALMEQVFLEKGSAPQPVPGLPASLARAKSTPPRQTTQRPAPIRHQAPVRQASWQPPFGAFQHASTPHPFAQNRVAPATATIAPGVPGHARQAIAYFGSGTAAQTLATMPPRLALPPRASTSIGPPRPRSKPFSSASNGATVSPYLNLYRDENEQSAPNYYAFVRPQLDQQEQNRQQRSQLQSLQRQVQRTSAAPRVTTTGAPLTGHRTRYMDTGGYFSGVGQ